MDSAWESKRYEVVLSLLQEDHPFPDGFDAEILNEDEVQRRLKVFVEERNNLHESIKNNNLEQAKVFISKNKSKFYYNDQNLSAAFTALNKKQFEIYAYLQSIGVNLAEDEAEEIDNLTFKEKNDVREAILSYLPRDDESHIYNLISKIKIKSIKTSKESRRQIFDYLEKLNKIPNVSMILKVIQCVDNLDLVLDLDDKNVKNVCPIATTDDRGITYRNVNNIYVAAGGGRIENEILGTLAHELTHMAMHAVFKNDCKPYFKSGDVGQNEFKTITANIKGRIRRVSDTPAETLCGAFINFYTSAGEEESEIIARLPHILAQYPDGEDWLSTNVCELYKFYESRVVPQFEKFISEKSFSTLRSLNRFTNESEGEIINVKKSFLAFQNINKVKNFLNTPDKNIFSLITEYTWLGLLRALQAIYGVEYVESYDKFLVLKMENIFKNLAEIEYLFNSEATDMLFIQFVNNIGGNQKSLKKLSRIMDIVKKKKNKKVIIIMKEEENEKIAEIVKDCGLSEAFVSETDDDVSVSELTENSQQKLLDYKILFQGIECNLSELINDSKDFLAGMNAEIIQDFLDNKKIEIGSKPLGMNSLEGAYADFSHEVNLESLFDEMKFTKSIFVVSCKKTSNSYTDIKKCLTQNINESLIAQLKNLECKISNRKRIFLTSDEVTDDDFKNFCNFNSEKKIYLLEERDRCKFILLKCYNPDFYFKRQFRMYKKVVIKKDILEKVNLKNVEDVFIIGKDSTTKLKNNANSPKIRFVDLNKMKDNLKILSRSGQAAHSLKCENDQLVWQESLTSLSGLRLWIDPDLCEEIILANENELRLKIMQEKVVILADEPGMGKTTTLTQLYDDARIFDSYWVIRINLRDHLKAIKNINDDVNDLRQIITFLTEVDGKLKSSFTKNFLNAALGLSKEFSKVLLLCFDGFDELFDDTDRENVLNLLIFLKNKTKCKIWITTRLHHKEYLENKLSVFSMKFEPIYNQCKESFIQNYMNSRLKLILPRDKYDQVFGESGKMQKKSKLRIYTKRLLHKAKEIFKDDIENFLGTPLQLHLLLEGSALSFQNWIENSVDLDFSYLGNNLIEVYEKYFDRKCEIFFKKKNLIEEESKRMMKKNFEVCHEKLADSLVKNKSLVDEILEYKSSLLLIGIIKDEGGNIQFVHITFREYFFTQFLIRIFRGTEESQQFYQSFEEEILVEEKYKLIRNFINAHLESKGNHEFCNRNKGSFLRVISSKFGRAYPVAIEERNNDLLDFLFSFNFSRDTFHSIFNKYFLFHLAIIKKNDISLNLMIELASKYNLHQHLLTAINDEKETAFHLAVCKKNNFAFNRITELASKYNLHQQLLTAVNDDKETAFHLAVWNKNEFAFNQIIKLASKYNLHQQLLTAVNIFGNTAFISAVLKYNDFSFTKIIELAAEYNLDQHLLTAINKNGNTPLHLAVKEKNDLAFNRICELGSKYNLESQLLTAANRNGNTSFHIAAKEKNNIAFNRVIDLATNYNLVQQLLTAVNKNSNTSFHLAVKRKNEFAFHRIINLASKCNLVQEILTAVNKKGNTAFYLAVWHKNDFAFNQIIKLASKFNLNQQLLTGVNIFANTAFHLAVVKCNDFAANQIIKLASKYNLDQQLLLAVNQYGNTAFNLAVQFRNDFAFNRIIELSSKYNLDQQLLTAVNQEQDTAFNLAVIYKNNFAFNQNIGLALKYNLHLQLLTAVNQRKYTPFHLAVLYKNDFAVNQIIELSSYYNSDRQLLTAVNEEKDTAFNLAVIYKNNFALNQIIGLALKYNLDLQLLTAVDQRKYTPFHLAVLYRNDFAVNQIIKLSSYYNSDRQLLTAVNEEKDTAFNLAVLSKNNFAVNRIIELSLKYNLHQQLFTSINEYGNTAIHLAVREKNDFALKRIIESATKYK